MHATKNFKKKLFLFRLILNKIIILAKNFNMKNMKTWLYVIIGLMVYFNWDKIKGMMGKKEDNKEENEK